MQARTTPGTIIMGHLWQQRCGTACSPARAAPATHLQRDHEGKVEVGDALELLKEVQRQEGEQRVLGGADGVAGVGALAQAQRVQQQAPQLGREGALRGAAAGVAAVR